MSFSRPRVLVAEDEPLIRLLIVEALEDAGFDVLEAYDGLKALRFIEQGSDVEVLVSDINMPGSSGLIVAARARQVYPAVPIILVTGRPDQVREDQLLQPFRICHKPFQMSVLVRTVREMLS